MAAAQDSEEVGALAPAVQQEVVEATARIRLRLRRTAEDIIEIGRDLILVKERLGHGHFLKWIKAEFEMSDETARNFMRVAEEFGSKIQTVWDLPPTVLYALASPSTPEPVRDNVIDMAQRGEKVTAQTVKDLKEKLKQSEAKAKEVKETLHAVQSRSQEVMSERDEARSKALYLQSQLEQVKAAAPTPPQVPSEAPVVDAYLLALLELYRAAPLPTQSAFREQIGG